MLKGSCSCEHAWLSYQKERCLILMRGVQAGNLCSLQKSFRADWSLPERKQTEHDFWDNVPHTKFKLNYLDTRTEDIWCKPSTMFKRKKKEPHTNCEARGGGAVVWGCFAAAESWPVHHQRINSMYQGAWGTCKTICKNFLLKLKWTMQHSNHSKHPSKFTKDWLKTKKQRVLEWPSRSLDLNPIEMLWSALKLTVHARKTSNISQLKGFCVNSCKLF